MEWKWNATGINNETLYKLWSVKRKNFGDLGVSYRLKLKCTLKEGMYTKLRWLKLRSIDEPFKELSCKKVYIKQSEDLHFIQLA